MKKEKLEKLKSRFGDKIVAVKEERGETTIVIDLSIQKELLRELRMDEGFSYDMLVDLCGVDYFKDKPRFGVVYLLRSLKDGDMVRIRVRLDESDQIETVSDLWKAANWLEREVYDMFGIKFKDHPDLRRILLSDDFVGHPLRKDFPAEGYDFDKPFEVHLEEEA